MGKGRKLVPSGPVQIREEEGRTDEGGETELWQFYYRERGNKGSYFKSVCVCALIGMIL